MPETWRPNVDRELMLLRAEMLKNIRHFMEERNILEVDTPVLSRTGNPEPNIGSLRTGPGAGAETSTLYLNTSPEFCMKRLLAADSGAIFQVSKVFRDDEASRLHQAEFSMLEWYRPAYDHYQLMNELSELLGSLGLKDAECRSYEDVFLEHLDINPHTADLSELQSLATRLGLHGAVADRAILLEFLFSHSVSPGLGLETPLLLYNYPACQAALARLSKTEPVVADRFELFIAGMEIANGFHELSDADEQAMRFDMQNKFRVEQGLPEVDIDRQFLSALQSGLPDCAGVAVGLDRLLMVIAGKRHINEVMSFPLGHA